MALLFGVLLLIVFPCVCNVEMDAHEEHVEMMLDPFDRLKDLLAVHTTGLSLADVNKLIGKLASRIHCTIQTNQQVSGAPNCGRSLCISGNDVFSYLSLADNDEVLESSFGDLSNLLVHYTTIAKNNCGQPVTINASKQFYSNELTRFFTRGQLSLKSLTAKTLQEAIDYLNDVYESDDEKDDEHSADHSDEHHDDDNDHSHEHDNEMTTKDHTDDHSHDHDDDHVTAPTTVQDDRSTEAVHDSHEHDDDHGSHEGDSHESEEHDHDDPKVNLHQIKCLSAGRLYDEMYKDPLADAFGDEHDLESLSQLLLYHMLTGDTVRSNCRLLPRRDYIENGLLQYVHAVNNTIKKMELKALLTALGLVQTPTSTVGTEDTHEGHDHRRRKRALPDTPSATYSKKCYSEDEIMAIYNSRNTDTLSKKNFLELCPSLIYQQVTKACTPLQIPKEYNLGTSEAYGYGTLAVFIVCLCAIAAILFIPLANTVCLNTFDYVLAIFLGLAVGTLVSDAILHLFPAAFGLHIHSDDEHNHGHGDEVVMEPYVGYGLAAIAGIYAFYFMEMLFNLLSKADTSEDNHGHSHLPTLDKFELHSGQKNGKSESRSELYEVRGDSDSETKVASPGAKSLILMVLVGDALHNFADGLAIGAAFTESPSVGIATTITVFCHELPHELGDYAILVSAGMSRARALCFNFLSSLTAFIGLYIGVSVSTDVTVRQWIFAITAGMFLYIALTDMLPHMANGGKGSRGKRLKMIICNNIGIFLGAVILLLLSLFESKIKVG